MTTKEELFQEPICAIATPLAQSAQGVIKVSGQGVLEIVDKLFRGSAGQTLATTPAYTSVYGWIEDKEKREIIDDGLLLVLRGPNSYTGEDTVELSLHGSPLILRKTLTLLIKEGCRLAEPGEFTRRAFSNGKMDLSQAEAVADVIAARNDAALRMARTQMRGAFRIIIGAVRDELLHFASLLELSLDFSEEDVDFVPYDELASFAQKMLSDFERLRDSYTKGHVIKEGIPIAIIGSTNAGKSTLLNTLLQEERAIVSDIHGTTRDTIEEHLLIDGKDFRFVDTAGLRTTNDVIERLGIEKSINTSLNANLILWVIDASLPTEAISEIYTQLPNDIKGNKLFPIINKRDMASTEQLQSIQNMLKEQKLLDPIVISARSIQDVEQLKQAISSYFEAFDVGANELIVSNLRHAKALNEACLYTNNLLEGLKTGLPADLIAQDLRAVIYHLSSIIGEITADDILQNIFLNFCIGK